MRWLPLALAAMSFIADDVSYKAAPTVDCIYAVNMLQGSATLIQQSARELHFMGDGKQLYLLAGVKKQKVNAIVVNDGDTFGLSRHSRMSGYATRPEGSGVSPISERDIDPGLEVHRRIHVQLSAGTMRVLTAMCQSRGNRGLTAGEDLILPISGAIEPCRSVRVALRDFKGGKVKLSLEAIAGKPYEIQTWTTEGLSAFCLDLDPLKLSTKVEQLIGQTPDKIIDLRLQVRTERNVFSKDFEANLEKSSREKPSAQTATPSGVMDLVQTLTDSREESELIWELAQILPRPSQAASPPSATWMTVGLSVLADNEVPLIAIKGVPFKTLNLD